ncbi:hypothetical protein, partial [Pseudoalteromonas distincta]|uniref:hypothetical protein n=1 Tax=Pseudoalteromonas distincta TaxID=77608 RepID=UPI003F97C003
GQACTQSDLYSFGATLFFLLTGKEPTPIAVSRPAAANSKVSQVLDGIVSKATSISLAERYQSATDILTELLQTKEYQ